MSDTKIRTGTLGLYKGFNILGYKSYHMVEVIAGGLDHIRIFRENIKLSHEQSSGAKTYGRPEFDKWFAGFDVSVADLCWQMSGSDI